MKKILAILLAVLMTVSLLACGAKTETASSEASASEATASESASEASAEEAASSEETETGASYTIGICNYVDDASLNQIVENI